MYPLQIKRCPVSYGTIAILLALGLFLASPQQVLSAVDTDDDGVTDALDNCPNVANADQADGVSAFIVTTDHTKYEYTLFASAHSGWPIWIPADTSKARIYAGNTLLHGGETIRPQENVTIYDQLLGTDYSWVDHGGMKQERLWINHVGQLDGPIVLLLLDDDDGHGNKCSPNLGIDFDGIPDGADNCQFSYNPHQEDTYGTPDGDACEIDEHLSENSNPTRPDWIYQGTATLFENTNYTGKSERIWVSDTDLNGNYIGPNAVSSIKIGRDTEIVAYTKADYIGTSERFIRDDPDLTANTIGDNTIVSLRIGSNPTIKAYKETFGIDFWSITNGHVGHILWSQLSALVASGAGSNITLTHDYVGSVKSLQVSYDGNADYTVTTTTLDGATGEIAYFHYQSASAYASERQIPGSSSPTTNSSSAGSASTLDYVHESTGQSWNGYLYPGVKSLFMSVYGTDDASQAAWEAQAQVAG